MKPLSYLLAFVLGAALASWGTRHWLALTGQMGSAQVVTIHSTAPAAPTLATAKTDEVTLAENRELAAELTAARKRLADSEGALLTAREDLAELRRPMEADVVSSTLRAEMKSGEVVVTGGYRLPDGTRAYAFVQPVMVRENGRDVLKVGGVLRAVDDATGSTVGLDNLATNADNTLQHGEVWVEDERRVIFEALDHVSAPVGVNLPEVNVPVGEQTRIKVGDTSIRVSSELGADRETLNFEVRLEQTKPAAATGPDEGAGASIEPVEPVEPVQNR